jgi:ribosomal protein L11 methyltransferase
VSQDRYPALLLRFPATATAASRDRLVALLAEHDLLAIQEDDLTAPRNWTAHFGSPAARDAAAAALGAVTGDGTPQVESADIEDDDWARRTQADLPAVRVGRVIVAPPWDLPGDEQRASGAEPGVVVEIEPSRGFGTGHHQSTRLCLVLLQTRDLAGRTVIDVGTGSGVLAIVAAKLGAAFASAIDDDPDAVENARENIVRNGVEAIVEAHANDVADSSLAPADVVTANLTGTLLARHARKLGTLVRPAGSLIVAGFTLDEQPAVLEAFAGAFDPSESAEEDGWCAFVLTRRV